MLHVIGQYDNWIKLGAIETLHDLQNDDIGTVKIVAGMHKQNWLGARISGRML